MGTQALTRLEVLEEHGAVDRRDRGRGGTCESGASRDGLLEIVDQRGAGHAGLAVDEHGAGAADLFEAVGVVGDGRGRLAGDVDGVERDLASSEMMFMPGRYGSSNFSQVAGASGLAWRLISTLMVLCAMQMLLLGRRTLLCLQAMESVEAFLAIDFIRRQVKRA